MFYIKFWTDLIDDHINTIQNDVLVLSKSPIPWFDDFLGVAYRYYDLRMNVAPLFPERRQAVDMWHDYIHWWIDPTIRIRFVETGNRYWFILGSDSGRPDKNTSFYKELTVSESYRRFKRGHAGEAYLRFGVYVKKYFDDVKDDAVCDCGHVKEDHDVDDKSCLYEDCQCSGFESFQVTLLKKKKTVTDIRFLSEDDIRDDPLAWNCLYVNGHITGRTG